MTVLLCPIQIPHSLVLNRGRFVTNEVKVQSDVHKAKFEVDPIMAGEFCKYVRIYNEPGVLVLPHREEYGSIT